MAALLHQQCVPDPEIPICQHNQQQQQHNQYEQGLLEASAAPVFTMQDEKPSEVLGRIEAELLTMLHGLFEGRVEMSVVICLCSWLLERAILLSGPTEEPLLLTYVLSSSQDKMSWHARIGSIKSLVR